MTTIPNVLTERLLIGETVCLRVAEREGDTAARGDADREDDTAAADREDESPTLVAAHPNPHSEYDVAVVEGLDRLEERPPEGPIEVEILGRFVDGHLAGRVASATCSGPVAND